MEIKILPVIKYKKAYEKIIADKIISWLWDNIFKECFEILDSKNTVYNSTDIIRNALEQGLIYYQDGAFYSNTGRFRNELARELENLGAKYSKYRKAYLLDKSKVPLEILGAIDTIKASVSLRATALQAFLTAQMNGLDKSVKSIVIEDAVNEILTDLQERVYKNAAEKKIELITPKLGTPKPKPKDKNKPSDKDTDKKGKDNGKGSSKGTGKGKGKDATDTDLSDTDLKDIDAKDTDKDIAGIDATKGKGEDVVYDFIGEDFAKNYTNNLDFWIKNWTEDHIKKMRSVVGQMALNGKSTNAIADYLKKEFGISARHAKFLARNETAIATTSYLAAKYKSEGITEFKWHTNLDGRERPLHKQLHGQIFRFDNPPIIDERTGEKGLPAQTYNCLTGDMQITSPFLHNRIFKRKFRGETVTLITSVSQIKLTPNHPVLTDKGWVKAGSLNIGDHIAKISNETILASGSNPNDTKTTIEEFYSFYSLLFDAERVALTDNDFHGDISVDKQVNAINIKTKLGNYSKPYIAQSRIEQVLTVANELFGSVDTSSNRAFLQAFPFSRFVTDCFIGSLDKAFAFFFGSESHTIEHTLRAITWLNSLLFEITGYDITRNSVFLSELLNAPAGSIKFYQLILWELAYTVINWRITEFSHSFGDCFTFNAEQLGQLGNSLPAPIEFDTITDKIISVFDGHIYNLQNSNNWYLTQYYITKNCRCTFAPVINKEFWDNRKKLYKAQNSFINVLKGFIKNGKI